MYTVTFITRHRKAIGPVYQKGPWAEVVDEATAEDAIGFIKATNNNPVILNVTPINLEVTA